MPLSLDALATPQAHGASDSKRQYHQQGNNGYAIRTCSTNMQSFACSGKRTSNGSNSSNGADSGAGEELGRIMTKRKEKVERDGSSWESPAVGKSHGSEAHDDASLVKHLFSSSTPSTPDVRAPWPSSGRPVDETEVGGFDMVLPSSSSSPAVSPAPWPRGEVFTIGSNRPVHSSDEVAEASGSTEMGVEASRPIVATEMDDEEFHSGTSGSGTPDATPSSKSSLRKGSKGKLPTGAASLLTEKQLKAINSMTPDQLNAVLTALPILASGQAGSSASDNSSQPCSSDDGDSCVQHERAKSAPPCQYSETAIEYPDLRKKRLSGARAPSSLKVRFECDKGSANDSDEETTGVAPGNISLRTRGRRLSRGPDGNTYKVKRSDDSPDDAATVAAGPEAEDDKGLSLAEAATAAAEGAKGAAYGGACGAVVGIGGALFTFGLSIPVCAIAGSTYYGYKGLTSSRSTTDLASSAQVRRNSEPPRHRA